MEKHINLHLQLIKHKDINELEDLVKSMKKVFSLSPKDEMKELKNKYRTLKIIILSKTNIVDMETLDYCLRELLDKYKYMNMSDNDKNRFKIIVSKLFNHI